MIGKSDFDWLFPFEQYGRETKSWKGQNLILGRCLFKGTQNSNSFQSMNKCSNSHDIRKLSEFEDA